MKATLTEEPKVYTIEVNGAKLPGMSLAAELGPVKQFKDRDGQTVYVYDGTSPHSRAFEFFDSIIGNPKAHDITMIAASPSLMAKIVNEQSASAS